MDSGEDNETRRLEEMEAWELGYKDRGNEDRQDFLGE